MIHLLLLSHVNGIVNEFFCSLCHVCDRIELVWVQTTALGIDLERSGGFVACSGISD